MKNKNTTTENIITMDKILSDPVYSYVAADLYAADLCVSARANIAILMASSAHHNGLYVFIGELIQPETKRNLLRTSMVGPKIMNEIQTALGVKKTHAYMVTYCCL